MNPYDLLPPWLQSPQWLFDVSASLMSLIHAHRAVGLFLIIFLEELGLPLPVPGDVAILWAGYMTRTNFPYALAFLCVVLGATLGSTALFSVCRKVGHGFLVRHGHHLGLDGRRLARAEQAFLRWGPWAIAFGRLIPGFRIVMSAFAGAFYVPYVVFVPSVLASSMLWALIFLQAGRYLGPTTRALFRLVPAHLLPFLLLVLSLVAIALLTWRRAQARRQLSGKVATANLP